MTPRFLYILFSVLLFSAAAHGQQMIRWHVMPIDRLGSPYLVVSGEIRTGWWILAQEPYGPGIALDRDTSNLEVVWGNEGMVVVRDDLFTNGYTTAFAGQLELKMPAECTGRNLIIHWIASNGKTFQAGRDSITVPIFYEHAINHH